MVYELTRRERVVAAMVAVGLGVVPFLGGLVGIAYYAAAGDYAMAALHSAMGAFGGLNAVNAGREAITGVDDLGD